MKLVSKHMLARVAVLIALGLPLVSAGQTCHNDFYSASFGVLEERFYVVSDGCQPQCFFSVWIYQESNGRAELQRCDENHPDNCDSPCGYDADTIIF